ncbi:MAG TPA: hypothetical protein VGC73_11700 [Pyrinomonadaceae bacterium]|jgi:hypothetical protein
MIVGVGGFTSQVGKTTLVCDLLAAFPGWEAIKTTRGHYRSCGKDPQACCVSHLLEDEAVVRSGRELTYTPGKDTGRYWNAGATNVHWLIATDSQVEKGINAAVSRVAAPGVFIEGNSFTRFIEPDYFVMVLRSDDLRIKSTAREALSRVSAFYLSGDSESESRESLIGFLTKAAVTTADAQMFEYAEQKQLINNIREFVFSAAVASQANASGQARIISVP